MKYPEFKFYGFKNQLNSETRMFELTENKIETSASKESYFSIFRFNQNLGLLRTVPEDALFFADYFYWDFDSKDLEDAFQDAKSLADRLKHVGCPFEAFFSGNKGFHIAVPSFVVDFEPTNNADKVKNFCALLASGLKSFDGSVYNKARIFRCPNSLNAASGMWKIPVLLDGSLSTILKVAKERPEFLYFQPCPSEDGEPIPELQQLFDKVPKSEPRVLDEESKFSGSVFLKAGEGNRNENAFTVARKLARRGLSLQDAKQIMAEVWNEKHCDPPLSPYELNKVIENAYERGINQVLEEGSYEGKITEIESDLGLVSKSYKENTNGFLTGYGMLDEFTMGFQPGESITIAARSGNFKSAFLTNILQRGSLLAKRPALFFSMEMGRDTLVPRLIQQVEGISKKQVITAFREGKTVRDFEKTLEAFKYVKFIYLSNLSTDQILGLLDFHKEKFGQPCAVGFDYLGLFRGCNNNTERTAKQAQEIKSVVAKASGCPVFTLVQAKQLYEGRGGDIELDRACPKDSDAILDLADYSIGLWGHWIADQGTGEEKKYIFGKFFKSRGMDDEAYGLCPYFGLNIEERHMRVNDVIHIPNPPRFKQKTKGDNE